MNFFKSHLWRTMTLHTSKKSYAPLLFLPLDYISFYLASPRWNVLPLSIIIRLQEHRWILKNLNDTKLTDIQFKISYFLLSTNLYMFRININDNPYYNERPNISEISYCLKICCKSGLWPMVQTLVEYTLIWGMGKPFPPKCYWVCF